MHLFCRIIKVLFVFTILTSGFIDSIKNLNAGELYKWKDKNGVVHYSEKPPEDQKAESINYDGEKNQGFKVIATLSPIYINPQRPLRHILFVRPDDFWDNFNSNLKTTYFFGGDCVSPSTAQVQEVQTNHSYLLPSGNLIHNAVFNRFRSANYLISSTNAVSSGRKAANYKDAVILTIEPVTMNYQVCANEVKRKNLYNKRIKLGYSPKDFSTNEFHKRRASVSLMWRLTDGVTGKTIFEQVSEGSADNWQRVDKKNNRKTLRIAIANAASNLLADETFVGLLTDTKTPKPRTMAKVKDKGFLESLSDMFSSNAVKKANFAKVLATVTPFKTMLVEYYYTEGQWPRDFSSMGVDNNSLYSKGLIDSLEIDVDGTIVINLSEETFENAAVIYLEPQIIMGGTSIDWQCSTNLSEDYSGNVCRSI